MATPSYVTEDDDMGYEIGNVSQQIFSYPPKNPNTIDIGIVPDSIEDGQDSSKVIFDVYIQILFHGHSILFPDKEKFIDLEKNDIDLLTQYMKSIGVEPILEGVIENNIIKKYRLHFKSVPPKKLEIEHLFVKFE